MSSRHCPGPTVSRVKYLSVTDTDSTTTGDEGREVAGEDSDKDDFFINRASVCNTNRGLSSLAQSSFVQGV